MTSTSACSGSTRSRSESQSTARVSSTTMLGRHPRPHAGGHGEDGGGHRAAMSRGDAPQSHRHPASRKRGADKLPTMHDWMRRLEAMGVTSAPAARPRSRRRRRGRGVRARSTDENFVAFKELHRSGSRADDPERDLFDDMRNLLTGTDDQDDVRLERVRSLYHSSGQASRATVRRATAGARTRKASTS